MAASSSGREGLIARPDPSSKPAGTVTCGRMRRCQCRAGIPDAPLALPYSECYYFPAEGHLSLIVRYLEMVLASSRD